MNMYMLSFTSGNGNVTRANIQDFLNTLPEVLNWYGVMPYTVLVLMDNQKDYSSPFDGIFINKLTKKFKDDASFLFTSISKEHITGYINKEVWDFINHPKSLR